MKVKLTTERKSRIISELSQTVQKLEKETGFPEDLQDVARVDFLLAHIGHLHQMLHSESVDFGIKS